MSKITKFSDRTPKCKLGTVGDFERLSSEAEAAQFLENEKRKIEEYQCEIEKEKARKYPSQDYIDRLKISIETIKENIRLDSLIKGK